MSLETTVKLNIERRQEDAYVLTIETGDIAYQHYEVCLDREDVENLVDAGNIAIHGHA